MENSEMDDIINYQEALDCFEENSDENRIHEFKSAVNYECLPLVESFQLNNLNEVSECQIRFIENDYGNQVETDFKDNDLSQEANSSNSSDFTDKTNEEKNTKERSNEIEEEIKSISSIEGSLKGLSSHSNYEELAGLSSSTPIIHLYPKLGKFFGIFSMLSFDNSSN